MGSDIEWVRFQVQASMIEWQNDMYDDTNDALVHLPYVMLY